ncbi:hypothetical protein EON65_20395, partial [archaeon]
SQPTVYPSTLPSTQPSSCPSVYPSVQPSSQPSCQPSFQSTTRPPAQPSTQPRASPTSLPISVPSMLPTTQTLLQPILQPTGQPSTLSDKPSSKPSSQPSTVPYNCPSSQPRGQPSDIPTSLPSGFPTYHPVGNLSGRSSQHPTVQPSAKSSVNVTTRSPSIPGTLSPTRNPSWVSSTAPTPPLLDQWKATLLSDLQTITVNDTVNDVVVRTSYYSLRFSDQSFYGYGCNGWTKWLSGEVMTLISGYLPSNIQMWSRSSLGSYVLATCQDDEMIRSILNVLLTPNSSTIDNVQSFVCRASVWKVSRNCSGFSRLNDVAICADCINPCNSSVSSLAPCTPDFVNQTLDPSISLLSLSFQDIDKPPVMQQIDVAPGAYKVNANVTLDKPGKVYCGLYGVGQIAPSSTEEVILQTSSGSGTSVNGMQSDVVASIDIATGINPVTSYTLYCYAVALASGATTSLPTMLRQAVPDVVTICCRNVNVRLAAATIPEGVDQTSSFLAVVVEGGRPRSALQIRVVLEKVELSNSSEVVAVLETFPSAFVPSLHNLSPAVMSPSSLSPSVRVSSSLSRLPTGIYRLSLIMTGSSASDYSITYSGGTVSPLTSDSLLLTVLPASAPLLAPTMLTSAFSSDGSYLQIAFSGETNRGGTFTRFSCARLFRFACAESSTCIWKDASNVWAYVSAEIGCAMPGQILSLAPSAAIKARCAIASCSESQVSWPNISVSAPSSVRTIAAPSVPISPKVVMSMPASMGSCSSVKIDVTSSTGHGGRAWNSSQVMVSIIDAAGNTIDATALQLFLLSDSYKLFPQPTIISDAYFQGGQIYTFQVTLCNFLGACASAIKRLVVLSSPVPSLSIPGSALRSMKRGAQLSLSANGAIPSCVGIESRNATTRQSLSYSWSITSGSGSNSVPELGLASISKDPARLLLSAYSLQVSTLYTVTVTASILPQLSSSASVSTQVYVTSGELIALIRGGDRMSMRVGDRLALDASSSYDEDISPSSRALNSASSSFSFAWSCVQLSPVLSVNCSLLFNQALVEMSSSTPLLQLQALELDSNSSASSVKWTVEVSDGDTNIGRSTQAEVIVRVLPSLSPVIELSASSPAIPSIVEGSSVKCNAGQPLQLEGRVKVPAQLSGWVSWQLDSSSSDIQSLSSVALTSSSAADISNMTLLASSTFRTLIFNLPLDTTLLPTGVNLLFSLSSGLREPGGSSTSSITVQINSPPRSGLFTISPDDEVELNFLFAFTCSRWIDEDLPLSYQFGFVSSAGSAVILRSKLPASFAELALPAGMPSRNYSVNNFAQIYDAYQAAITDSFVLRVRPVGTITTTNLSNYVADSVLDGIASNNVDTLKQTIAASSSLLNRVNCSLAPTNCSGLNRQDCYRTPHTCGPCLSYVDYIGDNGDSNNMCWAVDAQQIAHTQTLVQQLTLKSCPANCSGHGSCRHRSILTGEEIGNCGVEDVNCVAYCICDDDYTGSMSCAWTDAEIHTRRQLREQLILSLEKLIDLEDADSQSIQALISSLAMISQSVNEISQALSFRLLDIAVYIMENSASAGLSNSAVGELVSSIQSVLSAAEQSNSEERRRRRKLSSMQHSVSVANEDGGNWASADFNSIVQRSQSVLVQYVNFLSANLAPGQFPVQTTQPSFRIHVSKIAMDESFVGDGMQCSLNTSVALPLTAAESSAGLQTGSIVVPLCSNSSDSSPSLSISLLSLAGVLYGQAVDNTSSALLAHPVTLSLSAFPCIDPLTCYVDFVLSKQQFSNTSRVRAATEEDRQADAEQQSYNVSCRKNDYSRHEFACASDGKIYNITCQGQAEIRQGKCPLYQHETRCAALVGSASVDYGCRLVRVTADSITCSCPLVNLTPHLEQMDDRRLLAVNNASNNITVPSGVITVSYVSLLQATLSSFASTILTADDLNNSTVAGGYRVLATLSSFIFCAFAAIYFSFDADNKSSKIQAEEVRRRKAGSLVKIAGNSENEVKSRKQSLLARLQGRSSIIALLLGQDQNLASKTKKHVLMTSAQGFLEMAEDSLPKVLSARSFVSVAKEELKRHHRWLGVVFHYSVKFPRVLRVISLTTNIIIMLFIQSITYNLTHGDDGTCARVLSEADCLEAQSPFATGESKCYWVGSADADQGQCKFVQPNQSAKVVIFVAIFSALISIPFSILVEQIVLGVLAATTADRSSPAKKADDYGTVVPIAADMPAAPPLAPPSSRRRKANVISLSANEEVQSTTIAINLYHELASHVRSYFDQLQGEKEKLEFKGNLKLLHLLISQYKEVLYYVPNVYL